MRVIRTQEKIISSWQGSNNVPLVSICCITYNHESFIEDSLEGFLMQETNFPFEILIHDDASTDKTADIIRKYEIKYPKIIKPIYQTENHYSKGIKINPSFNFPRAKGNYIAFCEGDDFWTNKEKLQLQIEEMQKYPDCQLSFHPAKIIKNQTMSDTIFSRHSKNNKIFNLKEIIKGNGGFCPTASSIIKKEVFDNIPSFVENAPVGDYFNQVFGSINGGALYIDKTMSAYRIHSGGVWTRMESDFSSRKKFSFEMLHSLEELDSFFNFQYNEEISFIKSQVFSDILENKNFSIRDRMDLYKSCKHNIIGEQQTKLLDNLVKDYEHPKEENLYNLFGFGINRINYLINISKKNKYIYFETPKVGCSTIKRTLQNLEVDDSSKTPKNVHNKTLSPLLSPLQLEDNFTGYLTQEYVKFTFVRNPYTRILSCYLDKMVTDQDEKKRMLPQLGFEPTASISFKEFLIAIKKQLYPEMDIHWMPQHILLGSKNITLDFIGRQENFENDLKQVISKITHTSPDSTTIMNEKPHSVGANKKLKEYITEEVAELIYEIYYDDFVLYGYHRDPFNNTPLGPVKIQKYSTDIFFLIPTCEKYAHKADAIRNTWVKELDKNGFKHLFLIGKPEIKQANIINDTLYVPCKDDYESLLLKLILGYEYIYKHFVFHYVHKIDDDCFLDIEKFKAEIYPQIHSNKYFGYRIIPKGYKLDTKWHLGKCSHSNFEKDFSQDKVSFSYAQGLGYLLHREVLPTLIAHKDEFKKELETYVYSYEDFRIGEILYHHQIVPTKLKNFTTAPASDYIGLTRNLVYDIEDPQLVYKIAIQIKNNQLKQKDSQLTQLNQKLHQKDSQLIQLNQKLHQKDQYLKQHQSKINKLTNNRWYRFGQMSNKRKVWTIGKVLSKKIKLYGLLMSLNRKIEKIKLHFNKLQEFIKMYQLAIIHSWDLKLRQNNLDKIEKNDILLFSTMKNETFRLPYFLQYYRDLGVDHFILIDNDSDDGMMEYLKDQKDVSVYYTNKSYRDSHCGVYWLNYLLKKHGSNHWCLTCDPDEFLVYPHIDSRDLKELTSYLDSCQLRSLFAPLIDMYSNKYVDETYYNPGDDPLMVCPYFDKDGYNFGYAKNYRFYAMKGGVRQRVFNKENPQQSPLLNKTPLVKWKNHYAYIASTHIAIPRFLNENNNQDLSTGVLLHFKFMDNIIKKIAIELDEKQHWNDSYQYKQYNKVLHEKTSLFDENISTKYKNWHTLKDLGLLNLGKW